MLDHAGGTNAGAQQRHRRGGGDSASAVVLPASWDALTQALHLVVTDSKYGSQCFLGPMREEAAGVLVRLRRWDHLPDFLFGRKRNGLWA